VDEGLWSRARIGQRLTKKQGTPWAMLDHERVRMVPLRMHWWSDPE